MPSPSRASAGDSHIGWSSPTIEQALQQAAHAQGAREAVVQAAGFLVDHTEVLYDLDVDAAAAEANRLGMAFTRARCVHDHAEFIRMLADRVTGL